MWGLLLPELGAHNDGSPVHSIYTPSLLPSVLASAFPASPVQGVGGQQSASLTPSPLGEKLLWQNRVSAPMSCSSCWGGGQAPGACSSVPVMEGTWVLS